MRLDSITWPQAQEYFKDHDTVIVPLGSTECHGKHMPLGTDTFIPNRIAELLEEKTDALIAPTMPYGNTDYLSPFPGTISLGTDVLYQVMYQILEGLRKHGARRFIILNGHGGNNAVLDRLSLEFETKGCIVAQMNWWTMVWNLVPGWDGSFPWHGGHGGGEETAAMMAINEDLIDRSAICDSHLGKLSDEITFSGLATIRYKGLDIPMRRFSNEVTDNGWVGEDHPSVATKEWGESMINAAVDYIADFIEAYKKIEL